MMKQFRRWYLPSPQRGSLGATPSPDSSRRIAELGQTLDQLEERLRHLRTGVTNLAQLHQLQEQLETSSDQVSLAEAETQSVQQQIEELEAALTNQFFSWQPFREVFWQVVRFGGLGLVVGWLIRGCASS
ncbi:MAG TPA: hypothetical protein V6D07_01210 [Trichocoleus sp.]